MLQHWAPVVFFLSQLFLKQGYSQPAKQQEHHELTKVARSLQTKTAIYWYTEVTIGTQKFNLTVDTGSSDLWVYAPTNKDGSSVAPHSSYTCDPATSASKCVKEGNFSIGYGGDKYAFGASGHFVADKVSIASKTVPTMSVAVATDVGWPAAWSQDGFLGLSWNIHNQATPQQATFPQCLMNDPTVLPVFAIDFPSIGKEGGKVDIDFGYVNETKAAAGLVTALVDTINPTWTATGTTFTIGRDKNPVTTDGKTVLSQRMIFDTGAGPSMRVDPRVTTAYYNQVQGAEPVTRNKDNVTVSYKFPCDAVLPNLYLGFTDGYVAMAARQMSYHEPDAENMCTGPLESINVEEGGGGRISTLFFQSHYVVFDMTPSKPRIQIAQWNGTSDSLPQAS